MLNDDDKSIILLIFIWCEIHTVNNRFCRPDPNFFSQKVRDIIFILTYVHVANFLDLYFYRIFFLFLYFDLFSEI